MLIIQWCHTSSFVNDWTSHPGWEEKIAREPDYFKKAYERLDSLAFWFFEGIPPWNDVEEGWASTFQRDGVTNNVCKFDDDI